MTSHEERVAQAAEEFGRAMLTDPEFGRLLRLVRGEIRNQDETNCERYLGESWEQTFRNQQRQLRAIESKLTRQRAALRGTRATTRKPRVPAGTEQETA